MENLKKTSGFTIVELLIVIVVIGILAAITIVAYSGIQGRAHATTVRSDFANVFKKAELFRIDSSTDTYPVGTTTLTAAGIAFSKASYDALIWCNGPSSKSWALVADSKDKNSYYITSSSNVVTAYAGDVEGASGGTTCPAIGFNNSWVWLLQTPTAAWTM